MAGYYALVAQLVEHVLGKDEASGSIPLEGFLNLKSSVTPLELWRGSARENRYARDNSFSMH